MTNPLNRNKVIRFIRDYPHESSFSLINSDKSIIVRPGDPGETGTNSGDIIPDSNIPGCSVGLFGREGNPKDFNTIIDWWLDPDQRYKLNPIALMRLWASLYRSYFGYAKITRRLYPTSTSTVNVISREIDPAKDYSIELTSGLGNKYTWDATTQQYSGFLTGLVPYSIQGIPGGTERNDLRVVNHQKIYSDILGSYQEGYINSTYNVAPRDPAPIVGGVIDGETITAFYNKDIIFKPPIGDIKYIPHLTPNNELRSDLDLTYNFIDPVSVKRRIVLLRHTSDPYPTFNLGGLKQYFYQIFDEVNLPYSLIINRTQGPFELKITFTNPATINKFVLPNSINNINTAKVSLDEVNYQTVSVSKNQYYANKLDYTGKVKSIIFEFNPTTTFEYGHPLFSGIIQDSTSVSKEDFQTYGNVDFTDNYYSNTNPESYSIGSLSIEDELAKKAYDNLTIDNTTKWKWLPLTLPFNNPSLRGDINNLKVVLDGFDPTFEYEEDYASNRLIRLPNSPAEWDEHVILSNQLNRNPVAYWHNLRFSEVLNDLINYCRTTCLKFWRISPGLSVSNYKDYTENVIDIEPETRDIRDLTGVSAGAGRINPVAIQTFSLVEGSADIETSSAKDLWFLSGGGYTNVNLPSNILSEYIDTLIAEGKAT